MMALDMMPTAFLFLAAAPLLLALPVGMLRAVLLLLVPLVAGWQIWTLPEGTFAQVQFLGMTLDMMRVDKLSRVFRAYLLPCGVFGQSLCVACP